MNIYKYLRGRILNKSLTVAQNIAITAILVSVSGIVFAQSKADKAEMSLGLRKTDLYSEKTTTSEKTNYTTKVAGTSKKIERAFENAPPMVPHSLEGFPPITKELTICLTCHMPEIAPTVKATPLPQSHFSSFRPLSKINDKGELVVEGKVIDNTSDIISVKHDTGKVISQDRFDCLACHTLQSQNAPLVKNNFKPEFREKNLSGKSNLIDVLNEGL